MNALKFIRAIPQPRRIGDSRLEIQAAVFNKSEPNKPIMGLVVKAKVHKPPAGLPRPTPSAVLEWHGKRIRGLNYEVRHDNPDGSVVRGWHEHLWSPAEQDACVIPAHPEPQRKDLRGILQWGLKRWNIEVREEQVSVDDVRD